MDEQSPGFVDTDTFVSSDSPHSSSSSTSTTASTDSTADSDTSTDSGSADSSSRDAAGGRFASAEAGFNVPGVTKSSRFAANGAPHTEPIPTDVTAVLAGLAGACDTLLTMDMDAAPGCLPELVEQVVVQQQRLSAVLCRLVAGLSTHGDPETVGKFSASAWLQTRTRMTQAEAARVAKVSATVFGGDELLRTRRVFSDGRITAAHAEEIARAIDKFTPEHKTTLRVEDLLLDTALVKPAGKVRSAAQVLLDHLAPDTHEDDEKSDYDRRALAVVPTFGDTVDIRGFAAGLEGQELLDFFHRITIAPQGPDDTRTKAQRCLDGLLNYIRTRTKSQPSMGGFRPGIIVTTEYSELIRELERHTGHHLPAEPTIDDLKRIIAAHTGIHPDQLLYTEEDQEEENDGDHDTDQNDDDEVGEDAVNGNETTEVDEFRIDDRTVDEDETATSHTRESDLDANQANSRTEESAGSNERADELRDINVETANRPPNESDMDNDDSRITIPRQRPAPPPTRTAQPVAPPGEPVSPQLPPHQPNTGMRPSSTLPTTSSLATQTPPPMPPPQIPSTRMPTWQEFIQAAEHITDPQIRHLLNGAAATTAWAQVDHVMTRPPGTRTLNGHHISAGTLRRLLCDANIIPAVLDGRGQILDLGASKRTFTVAQRRALILRDKHCRWKGCTMPHQYCQAHHGIPWNQDGPTNIDVAFLLCDFHHHRSHEKNVDLLQHLDLPEPVRQLAAYYLNRQKDRRDSTE